MEERTLYAIRYVFTLDPGLLFGAIVVLEKYTMWEYMTLYLHINYMISSTVISTPLASATVNNGEGVLIWLLFRLLWVRLTRGGRAMRVIFVRGLSSIRTDLYRYNSCSSSPICTVSVSCSCVSEAIFCGRGCSASSGNFHGSGLTILASANSVRMRST